MLDHFAPNSALSLGLAMFGSEFPGGGLGQKAKRLQVTGYVWAPALKIPVLGVCLTRNQQKKPTFLFRGGDTPTAETLQCPIKIGSAISIGIIQHGWPWPPAKMSRNDGDFFSVAPHCALAMTNQDMLNRNGWRYFPYFL